MYQHSNNILKTLGLWASVLSSSLVPAFRLAAAQHHFNPAALHPKVFNVLFSFYSASIICIMGTRLNFVQHV